MRVFIIAVVSLGTACASSASGPNAAPEAEQPAAAASALPAGCVPPDQTVACTPITNAGCGAGEACDDDDLGGFKCYQPPNEVAEGGDCNVVEGPSCKAGLMCAGATADDPDGTCARFCCSSAECGGKTCQPIDPKRGSLGYCG